MAPSRVRRADSQRFLVVAMGGLLALTPGCFGSLQSGYAVQVQNDQDSPVTGNVTISAEDGRIVSEHAFSVPPGAAEDVAKLPADPGRYVVRVGLADGRTHEESVFRHPSYSDVSIRVRPDGISIVQAVR